ncbi:hypothetical protein [Algoriphagus sp.]|uniref:hypothetical protein n=1 Tax=Algoriphagus sp. TaxID=1872435 RepID=UPI0039194E54
MTNFKRVSLLLFVFIGALQPLFSQSQDSGLKQWEALITRQIKYPIEALRVKKEGVVAIALSIDEKGSLKEINLEKKAAPYLTIKY